MNDKYVLKFEAGLMEQIFKFDVKQYPSLEMFVKAIDEPFINKVRERFNDMYLQLSAAMTSN